MILKIVSSNEYYISPTLKSILNIHLLSPFPMYVKKTKLEIRGFEPLTYGLQSRRSSQLSYIPDLITFIKREDRKE